MIMTGEKVDGEQALSWGLIDLLVEVGNLEQISQDFALKIAQHDSLALALTKRLVDQVSADAVTRGFHQEMMAQRLLLSKRSRDDNGSRPPAIS
jgi:enoyl-CoA hydratase/carnithine racemase